MAKPFNRGARGPTQTGGAMVLSPKDLNSFLTTNVAGELARVIPAGVPIDVQMIIGQAVNAVRNSPALQKCSLQSIGSAIMYAGQVGLELCTPRGHAWLIPYKSECTYQVGYKGLGSLAYRSGKIHNLKTEVVYARDQFTYVQGGGVEGRDLFLYEKSLEGDRGEWKAAFLRVIYPKGPDFIHVMTRAEIEHVRDTSSRSAYDTDKENWTKSPEFLKGPWKDWADEMRKKTVCKQGLKMLDLAPALNLAIGLDDQAMGGARQDRVVEVKDWSVIDVKALSAGESTGSSTPAPQHQQGGGAPAEPDGKTEPQDPKLLNELYTPKEGEGLSLERNFSPEDQKWILTTVAQAAKWNAKGLENILHKGPGNRAHVESELAKWKHNIKTLMDMLEEVRVEAQANHDFAQGVNDGKKK